MNNNLYEVEKSLRSIAKRYKSIKYSIGLAILFLMLGIGAFSEEVDSSQAKGIHGLAEENEDIRVHVVKREQAYQWMCEGKIDNGIAVIGLQWLQLNYAQLQQRWKCS